MSSSAFSRAACGIPCAAPKTLSFCDSIARVIRVSMNPNASEFARMLNIAPSMATVRVNPAMPAFAAA